MGKFLLRLTFTFLLFFMLLEIVLRLFSFAGHTLPVQNIDGDYLLKPAETGYWVKGGFKEINSHYTINKQGWNSLRDYNADNQDSNLHKIALIGDSYIEGFHNDVESSIGRQLEKDLGPGYAVHEFGRSGGNIVDFSLIYEKYHLADYLYTFVLVANEDLIQKHPSFMTKGGQVPELTLTRKIYNSSAVLRYLNINHGMNDAFRNLLQERRQKGRTQKVNPENVNSEAISRFRQNTVFIYEDEKVPDEMLELIPFPKIKIQHTLKPYNHGFDGHWNLNGRKNCAHSIFKYIRSKHFD